MTTPATAPAGRRRFWTTVLAFAVANTAVWLAYDHLHQRPPTNILAVTHAAPTDLLDPSATPTFSWSFNLPAAPAPGTPAPTTPLVTFTPAIPGNFSWPDPKTLAFRPTAPLPRATRFTATLNPLPLTTPEGYTLDKPFTTTFSTPALALLSARQAAFDSESRTLIELHFNDTVSPQDALSHLTFKDASDKTLPASLVGQAPSPTLRILVGPVPLTSDNPTTLTLSSGPVKGPTAAANHITLLLSPGLTGAAGPLGITDPLTRSIPLTPALLADNLTASAATLEVPASLILSFNNPLPENAADLYKPLLAISPEVPFTLRTNGNRRSLSLDGPFQPSTRYTLTLTAPANLPAATPKSKTPHYPQPASLSVFIPDIRPALAFDQSTGYLGSHGNRSLHASAINISDATISIVRLYDNNLLTWRNTDTDLNTLARPLISKPLHLAAPKNQRQDITLSLDDLLQNLPADGVYRVFLTSDTPNTYAQTTTTLSLSDIGLTAKLFTDDINPAAQSALVWALSLSTGKPLPHIHVRLFSNKNQPLGESTTDDTGLARITNITPAQDEHPVLLLADNQPTDTPAPSTQPSVLSPQSSLTWLDLSDSRRRSDTDTSGRPYLRDGFEAFPFSDRGVYRPGESVSFHALLRDRNLLPPPAGLPLKLQLLRPDGHPWQSASAPLSPDGLLDFAATFPSDAPTGYWTLNILSPGDAKSLGSLHFQIEEFLPDRLKTTLAFSAIGLSADNPRLDRFADPFTANIQSDYLFGQPAADLKATLNLRLRPTQFPAPDGFLAGDTAAAGPILANQKLPAPIAWDADAITLDKSGHAAPEIDLSEKIPTPDPASPYSFRGPWSLSASESTLEISGRAVTAVANLDIDALPYYVCVHAPATTPHPGQPTQFPIRIVSPGVSPMADTRKLIATVYRQSWETHLVELRGQRTYESVRTLTKENASANVNVETNSASFTFTPESAGSFVLEVVDPDSSQVTTIPFYVGEDGGWADNTGGGNQPDALDIKLLPSEPQSEPRPSGSGGGGGSVVAFHPSQSATALIHAPFSGQLLLTIESDTILSSQVLTLDKNSEEVAVKLPDHLPANAFIAATVIRPIEADKPWRIHRAYGISRFTVDQSEHNLAIKLTAPPEMRPRHTLDVDLAVTDSQNLPAKNAAVTLYAVDEGILRLTTFHTPDPFKYFTAPRALAVETSDLYNDLLPEVPKPQGLASVGGDESAPMNASPVTARRVVPVALASALLHTDDNGIAHAHLQVPQFLGQLRVMAIASDGPRFGSAQTPVTVRSPLVVQSTFPRFLAPGDSVELPFLFINNSPAAGDVSLHLAVDNGDPLEIETPPAIHLDASQQKKVLVKVHATNAAGVAHINLSASMGTDSYDEQLEVPVRPASPRITVGSVLTATPEKPATFSLPQNMLPGTAHAEVSISPLPELGLPAALDYLDHYPYGCVEQTTSQLLPLVYLPDIGKQIAPALFDADRVDRKLHTGFLRLLQMQTSRGGLAMWAGGSDPWPYGSVYAAHLLVLAKKAGHDVPEDFQTFLLAYVRSLLDKSPENPEQTETQAYAAYVLALAGTPDRPAMNRLADLINGPEVPSTARLYLILAQAAAGHADIAASLLPTDLPPPRLTRAHAGTLGSPIHDQALLLTTLLTLNPDHPAIPGLVERLAAAANPNDAWGDTHDNALALLALGQYFRQTKNQSPFTTAILKSGDAALLSLDNSKPGVWSPEAKLPTDLTATTTGGTAFITWRLSGVPLTPPPAADHALHVTRAYLDVLGNPLPDHVASGTAVKVRITLESPDALQNVVVDDLLPAGLEIENPRLDTARKSDDDDDAPADPKAPRPLSPARLDLRDDRLVFVADLPSGKSTYEYLARAVTAGHFVVPPIQAACMYDPGITSLGTTGTLSVTAK